MMLYLIGGLIAATLVASGIAGCEHKQKNAIRAEREAVQARFDGFVIEARRKGEEQEKLTAAREAADREYLQTQKAIYETRLQDLRSERDAAKRVLDHYAANSSQREMSGLSNAAGPPGQGQPDAVLSRAFEQLARDAQETTLMFNECRDSWKKVSRQ